MVKEQSSTEMETITKENLSTVCLKGMDSIYGLMAVHIKEISSKVKEADMVCGKQVKRERKAIRVII